MVLNNKISLLAVILTISLNLIGCAEKHDHQTDYPETEGNYSENGIFGNNTTAEQNNLPKENKSGELLPTVESEQVECQNIVTKSDEDGNEIEKTKDIKIYKKSSKNKVLEFDYKKWVFVITVSENNDSSIDKVVMESFLVDEDSEDDASEKTLVNSVTGQETTKFMRFVTQVDEQTEIQTQCYLQIPPVD